MKPKKAYNNLVGSIVDTALLVFTIFVLIMSVVSSYTDRQEAWNFWHEFGLRLVMIGPLIILEFVLLVWNGYSYWYMDKGGLWGGSLFRRKTHIPYASVTNVKLKSTFRFAHEFLHASTLCTVSDGTHKVIIHIYDDEIDEIPPGLYEELRPYRDQITIEYLLKKEK